jgi:hypothetical protein
MRWRRVPERPQRYTACMRSCTPCSTSQWPKECLLISWAGFLVPFGRLSSRDSGVTIPWNWCCRLLPLSVKLHSVHAVNTTPHKPSRISRLSVTFEILLASFRPVTPFLQYYTHPHFNQRDLCKEHVSRKVRISKTLLYIRFRTHKRLLQSASAY